MMSNIALRPRATSDGTGIEWVAESVPEYEVHPPVIKYIAGEGSANLSKIAEALMFAARTRA